MVSAANRCVFTEQDTIFPTRREFRGGHASALTGEAKRENFANFTFVDIMRSECEEVGNNIRGIYQHGVHLERLMRN
jgi:hypothetical protein